MNNIPVFLISDENYAMYMATTIASILSNTKSFVDFYVLDGGIKEETKEKIKGMSNNFDNFSIEFIEMDDNLVGDFPDLNHFSKNTYYRYFIPNLKPELSKILYIDTDMIVKCDIEDIYNIEMNDTPLYVVPYYTEYKGIYDKWIKHIKKKFDIKNKYFNAGLLLMNCEYFRRKNIPKLLVQKTNEYAKKLECPDQDILNMVFQNELEFLDYRYNVVVDVTHKKDPNYLEEILEENQGCILHFTGGGHYRPWLNSKCVCGEYFFEYAKLTPFYDELREDLEKYEVKKGRIVKRLPKLKKAYKLTKVLSKVTFGKTKEKFKKKAKELKKTIKIGE